MRKQLQKQFLAFIFLALGCIPGHAESEKVLGIIVELTSGEKIEYQLSKHPKLVFDGQTITLTATNINVEYTVADFAKVTTGMVDYVEDIPEGINELPNQQGAIDVASGFVRFSGFAAGETIKIYSTAGVLQEVKQTDADGTLVLSVASLPQGISIIKINKQSIKITRK